MQHPHDQQEKARSDSLWQSSFVVSSTILLIPLASDKMKIHTPPDRIAGICRFVGSNREITFFHAKP